MRHVYSPYDSHIELPSTSEILKDLRIAAGIDPTEKTTLGWLFRPWSLWIGMHYSSEKKRFCINFVPMLTFWIVLPGGYIPNYKLKDDK